MIFQVSLTVLLALHVASSAYLETRLDLNPGMTFHPDGGGGQCIGYGVANKLSNEQKTFLSAAVYELRGMFEIDNPMVKTDEPQNPRFMSFFFFFSRKIAIGDVVEFYPHYY
jgi:hypothetical protein